VVAPRLPSHGFAVTVDEAKAAFAETWRKWLALKGGPRIRRADRREEQMKSARAATGQTGREYNREMSSRTQ
jgi:hypothetical protein